MLAFLIIRISLVQAYSGSNPSRLTSIWPGHPAAILESGLAAIGEQAAAGKPVDPALVNRLLRASAKAPLAPEPFLVRGVEAQVAGDQQLALQAFLAARERSPRNNAARYFLADQYLKSGNIGPGLAEVSVLARLVPQSLPNVAPYLAAFARSPDAAPQVKAVLRKQPQLEPVLLDTLANDAANADLILSLWSGRGGDDARPWQGRLLTQLVESGRYELARKTWAQFTGVAAAPDLLFDPEFGSKALPPFGWSLASGPAGVAEAEGGGRLHILYYGRDDAVLASQLLTLRPGRYRVSMIANFEPSSPTGDSLRLAVSCLPASSRILEFALDFLGPASNNFSVPPANCSAQQLEFIGEAPEFPEQADVTISQFDLQPEAGQ